jgi:hypothetical protein
MKKILFSVFLLNICLGLLGGITNPLVASVQDLSNHKIWSSKGLGSALDDDEEKKKGLSNDLKPQIGLFYGPFIPLGTIAESMGMGLVGVQFFTDFLIPRKTLHKIYLPFYKLNLDLRIGISAAYTTMNSVSSDFDGTMNLIPITGYIKFSYYIKALRQIGKIEPYILAGSGISLNSIDIIYSDEITGGKDDKYSHVTKSTMEGAVYFSFGVAYAPRAIRSINFLLAGNYLMYGNNSSASFLAVSLGIAYQF